MSGLDIPKFAVAHTNSLEELTPLNWKVMALGEASASINSGKTNTKGFGQYPLYGSTGKIGTCSEVEHKGNSILVARVGANAGRLYFVTGSYGVSDNTLVVKLFKSHDIGFFKHALVRANLNNLVFGSGQPLITGSLLKAVNLLVPPSEEQSAIANALSDVDVLITSLEKLIDKKRVIKTAAMQQLLTGKKRLPPFDKTHSGYQQTELGEIPKDWEVHKFGDCTKSFQLGGNYKNDDSKSGLPLIKMGNIARGNISTKKVEYIPLGTPVSEKDRCRNGDIYFNTRNTLDLVGKVCIWSDELPVAYFNSNLMRIVFKGKFVSSNKYMNYLMNTDSFVGALADIAIGTTSVAAIYTRDLVGLKIALPPLDEQLAIADVLWSMDEEVRELVYRLTKTRQLKQGMMQELLTGKTRLL